MTVENVVESVDSPGVPRRKVAARLAQEARRPVENKNRRSL